MHVVHGSSSREFSNSRTSRFFRCTVLVGMAPMIVLRWRVPVRIGDDTCSVWPLVPVAGTANRASTPRSTRRPSSGVVSVKGVPATGGTILFNPSNSGPARPHPVGSDRTGRNLHDQDTDGDNQVSFEGEVAKKNAGVGLIKDFAEVTSGENKKDFDLMGKEGGRSFSFRPTANVRSRSRGANRRTRR